MTTVLFWVSLALFCLGIGLLVIVALLLGPEDSYARKRRQPACPDKLEPYRPHQHLELDDNTENLEKRVTALEDRLDRVVVGTSDHLNRLHLRLRKLEQCVLPTTAAPSTTTVVLDTAPETQPPAEVHYRWTSQEGWQRAAPTGTSGTLSQSEVDPSSVPTEGI